MNEFRAHIAFCLQMWCPINSETGWCLYSSRSSEIVIWDIFFYTHKLQTSTIYTFCIYKYSLKERALNNKCKIFTPLLLLYTQILFGLTLKSKYSHPWVIKATLIQTWHFHGVVAKNKLEFRKDNNKRTWKTHTTTNQFNYIKKIIIIENHNSKCV